MTCQQAKMQLEKGMNATDAVDSDPAKDVCPVGKDDGQEQQRTRPFLKKTPTRDPGNLVYVITVPSSLV
jgi:hypothetical protein